MKRLIIILLLLPLMFACSSDKDNEPEIDYIDNNLIEGKWVFVNGASTQYRIFENNSARDEFWHTYQGDLKRTIQLGSYKLSKDKVYYNGPNNADSYTLKDDILTFTYKSGNEQSFTKVNP